MTVSCACTHMTQGGFGQSLRRHQRYLRGFPLDDADVGALLDLEEERSVLVFVKGDTGVAAEVDMLQMRESAILVHIQHQVLPLALLQVRHQVYQLGICIPSRIDAIVTMTRKFLE